jgi:hypothetical protein
MGKGDKVKKEKEFIPEESPWKGVRKPNVVILYGHMYNKALELAQSQLELFSMDSTDIKWLTKMHIDNMIAIIGRKEWLDEGVEL